MWWFKHFAIFILFSIGAKLQLSTFYHTHNPHKAESLNFECSWCYLEKYNIRFSRIILVPEFDFLLYITPLTSGVLGGFISKRLEDVYQFLKK